MTEEYRHRLDDPARLESLRRLALLDMPPVPAFERLTRMVTILLGVPIALVTLVEDDRQFFASAVGLAEPWASHRQTPLTHSFCRHVVAAGAPLVIPDARAHPLVHDNPAIAELGIVAYAGFPLIAPDGHVLGSLCAIDDAPRDWAATDLTLLGDLAALATTEIAHRATAAELRAVGGNYRLLLERAADGIFVMDAAGRFVEINARACAMLGYTREELLGLTSRELIAPADLAARPMADPAVTGHFLDERTMRRRDGTTFLAEASVTRLPDGRMQAILRDVTARRAREERLRHQASHDSLTGLPNRAYFLDRLRQALARAVGVGQDCAVLFLDLDHFKRVNDRYGHDAGNQLLVAVAARLRGAVRPEDTLARLGGDEFVALLEAVADAGVAEGVAARLLAALDEPVTIDGRRHAITASIGIALCGPGHAQPDDLLRDADAALYRAKAAGRAGYIRHE